MCFSEINYLGITEQFFNLMCTILQIQEKDKYKAELARGTKPYKAAIKSGAQCPRKVLEVMAGAKLAMGASEINEAYRTQVKSCMQGESVGRYYDEHLIGCIWSKSFRILVGLETFELVGNGYGFHSHSARTILGEFGVNQMNLVQCRAKYKTKDNWSGEEIPFLDWFSPVADEVAFEETYSEEYKKLCDLVLYFLDDDDTEIETLEHIKGQMEAELPEGGVHHDTYFDLLGEIVRIKQNNCTGEISFGGWYTRHQTDL